MAVVFVSITPLGTGTSVSRFVAGVEEILRGTRLTNQLTAMGTIIEGDLDEILAVIRRMHERPFAEGALRVSTLVKIDDRRDKEHTIAGKMRSVEQKLAKGSGRALSGASRAPRAPSRRRAGSSRGSARTGPRRDARRP